MKCDPLLTISIVIARSSENFWSEDKEMQVDKVNLIALHRESGIRCLIRSKLKKYRMKLILFVKQSKTSFSSTRLLSIAFTFFLLSIKFFIKKYLI